MKKKSVRSAKKVGDHWSSTCAQLKNHSQQYNSAFYIMGKFTFIKLVTEQQLTVCSLGIIPASYSHLGQQISLDHIEFCVKLYTEYSLVYKIQTKNNVSVFSD